MLRKTALALVFFLALLAIGVGLLASEPVLRWTVQHVSQRTDGRLQVDGVSGSLFGRIRFAKLTYRHPSTEVIAEQGHIQWSPFALLSRRVSVQQIEARSLTLVQRKSGSPQKKPPQLPDRLQTPLQITLDQVHIGQLLIAHPGGSVPIGEVTLSASTGDDAWSAKLISLQSRWGKAAGNVEIGTQRPFAVTGAFDASNQIDPSYNAKLQLGGALEKIDLRAEAQAQPPALAGQPAAPPATLTAVALLTPFAATPFERIQVDAQNLDLRAWRRRLPTAQLEIHLAADGDADKNGMRGQLQVSNHAPGSLDARRIPLSVLTTAFSGSMSDATLPNVLLDLGKAGKLEGNGNWRSGKLTLDMATRDLNLQGLNGKLKRTRLAGNLRITESKGMQRAKLDLAQKPYRIAFAGTLGGGKLVIEQLRAAAGRSNIVARGTLGMGQTKPLQVDGTLTQFDPSQFGKYPSGSLNSRFKVNAALAPVLQVNADLLLYDSQISGLAANGTIKWHSRGTKTPDIAIDLAAHVGTTRAQAKGTLIDPVNMGLLDLRLELEGQDLAELYPIIGVPMPSTPPYKLSGHLKERNQLWEFRRFNGVVGRSDLAGDFIVDRRNRQFMKGTLVSNQLALEDLSGFIGMSKRPKADTEVGKEPKTAKNAKNAKDAKDAKDARVLPDDPFNPEKLRASDADIWFTGKRVVTEKLPLTDMTAHLKLKNGIVTLEPLDFGAAGGHLVSVITLNARKDVITGLLDAQIKSAKVNQLVPGSKVEQATFGDIDGRARLTTRGNSIARMLGSSNGKIVLLMEKGAISDLVLRLIDLDIANAGVTLVRGDRNIPVRCFVADFDARDGHLRPHLFALDTEHTLIAAEGEIDLKDERLDLKLVAKPKGHSLAALRGPIVIGGTFADPSVRPEFSKALLRGAAAVALGLVATPFAAILPFIQIGDRKDVDCAKVVSRARGIIEGDGQPSSDDAPTESARK